MNEKSVTKRHENVRDSNIIEINTTEIKLLEGYFQFIHHSGSEETISPIDLLFATNFCQRNGEDKVAVNFYRTMTYGMVFMRGGILRVTRIKPTYRGFP